jgi:uncharacterized membrane protein
MRRILVAVFDSEPKGYEGSRILWELDGESAIEVLGLAVIAKDANGEVAIKEASDPDSPGLAAGLLAGSLIGLLAGPVGFAIGAGGGSLAGALFDLAEVGVGADFLEEIGRELEPGKVAVVADVWEDWVTPVDTRIEAAGGTVLRRVRAEIADAQIAREAEALKAEAAELRAEMARAAGAQKAKLEARIEGIRKKLRADQERTQAALASVKRELEGTVARVQAKAAKAQGERKARLEARATAMRADLARRGEKLQQAAQLIKQALEV